MEARKIFERYWDNKTAIVMYQGMIERRKLELMPSLTPFLSLTPKGRGIGSSVESTVLKWEEDETIQKLLYKQTKAQNEINLVDSMISALNPKTREIIRKRYVERNTVEKVAEDLDISESTVIRIINSTFEIMDNVLMTVN